MIICSCKVLTHHDVRSTLYGAEGARTAGEVYDRLGCSSPHNPPNFSTEALAAGDSTCRQTNGGDVNAVGEGAALTDIAFEPVSSNQSLRCGETEFSGQRQRGRNGLGDSRTPVQRQNLARQLRQFGANRGVPGNLR